MIRKQRDIAVAQEQLKQMTSLSQQVVHDLKSARQRHNLAKRETKAYEAKVESMTRKLYKLTSDTKQAEEKYANVSAHVQAMDREQLKVDKVCRRLNEDSHRCSLSFIQAVDEKRALSLVLDEQLRHSFQSFNSLLNSSVKCLQDLTSATSTIEEDFRFHSIPPSPMQLTQLSSALPPDEIQRQISHIVSENNRLLARYHMILQQQKQKSTTLQNEINEKENSLANVKANLEAYNEQLRRNAQELLQVRFVASKDQREEEGRMRGFLIEG